MPTLFLAQRFLRGITQEKTIATMLMVCTMSIALSSCALTLIITIAQGFQQATINAMQGMHSDCTLQAPAQSTLNFNKIHAVLRKDFATIVAGASPIAHQHAIIQKDNKRDLSHVVIVQGIDPEHEQLTRPNIKITSAIKKPWATPGVIIGNTLAKAMKINLKETITLLYVADDQAEADENLRFITTQLPVNGFFATGVEEMDERIILCSLPTFTTLFPGIGVTHVNIKLQPDVLPEQANIQLKQRFKLDCFSWYELYPALLDALALERKAMLLIVMLVACIASITTIALLLMYLMHQQRSIALLKTMGMSMRTLRTIFTIIGVTITVVATTIGLLSACIISMIVDRYQLIQLPSIYYVNYVPAQIHLSTLLLVLCIMIFVSLITSWWATGYIKKMNLTLLLKG